jgi:hypothetical protein
MYDLYHFYALLLFVYPETTPYIRDIDKLDPYMAYLCTLRVKRVLEHHSSILFAHIMECFQSQGCYIYGKPAGGTIFHRTLKASMKTDKANR